MSSPRVAVLPERVAALFADAIHAAGGEAVPVAEAEALLWTDPDDAEGLSEVLGAHPGIRWIQLPWAGIEPLVGVLDPSRTWTCAKGAYGDEVAEHTLGLALAGMRDIARFARATTWGTPSGRSLIGATVTILGGGGLAEAMIRMLEPFGCRINVLRRSTTPVEGADLTGTLVDLPDVLPGTDLLVVMLPLTPETTDVIDAAAIALLPSHAWIVNVGRGRHIVTDDLVAALREGSIGGAALDVTDPEPLPDDHPLWSLPNCIITPHTANTPKMAFPSLSERLSENVRRFAAGEELVGLVDLAAGY